MFMNKSAIHVALIIHTKIQKGEYDQVMLQSQIKPRHREEETQNTS